MTPEKLTQSLRQEALRLGFSFAGVCPAVTPTGFHRFLDWLDAGYAGEMHYLEDRKSAYEHPESVLPDVKSILMLAMNYRTADRTAVKSGEGNVARYAWGQADYHDVIHQRLKQLKRFAVEQLPQCSVRGVVDTAPLLEREFAQLAGMGWIGKNTLLLNKHHGSYFFLAALLVDQTLIYDEPHETAHCGTCTACLDACPTDAFTQPFVLDATKCISYLTIEHRSEIASELRLKMDQWILGCDVCQDVCPWNRKAPRSSEPAFEPVENPLALRPLFDLDDDQFRARFRKTPLWRPKRRGILRNAAIAMAGQPDDQNVPALMKGIVDEEPMVRAACIWSISFHLSLANLSAIQERIQQRLAVEFDEQIVRELSNCLEKIERFQAN